MLKYVPLAALFLLTHVAYAQDKQFPDASETTPELIELYDQSDAICRGQSGNDVTTWASCAARAVYGTALNEREWCYGRENEAGFEMEWHECEATSLRFKPVDLMSL